MKQKIIATLMTLLLVIGMTPVFAVEVGTGVGIGIETEDFAPEVYFDSSVAGGRVLTDDGVDDGRNTFDGALPQRTNNYAFEGESVTWRVLVHDRNGIETLMGNPVATVGTVQGEGNDQEALCAVATADVDNADGADITEFNVRDGPELLDEFEDTTMRIYTCELTVEGADSMDGEYWVTVEASDSSGLMGTAQENEFWWFNPVVALDINGALEFGTVRPGATSYSSTLTVGNDATPGSGVMLEMFVSGTDFTDPLSSGAKCPVTNELGLDNFGYLATNGAYSSSVENVGSDATLDAEGYSDIREGTRITESRELIGGDDFLGDGSLREDGNVLAPGAEVSVTLKLDLPNPCNGNFVSGSIWFWALAV